jgi:hypothetical protein
MCACCSVTVVEVSEHHVAYLCIPSWEFITTLDYEWSVIQGRRPYQWTIWVCVIIFGLMLLTTEAQSDVFLLL